MELASRSSYRGQLTKLVKSANEYLSSDEFKISNNLDKLENIEEELEVLLDRLTSTYESLRKANTDVLPLIKIENLATEADALAEYNDKSVGMITRLKHRLSKVRQHQTESFSDNPRVNETTEAPRNPSSQAVKLTKLNPKKFCGDFKDWVPFWEQYRTLIHENASLTTIDKFNYLESVLVGRAFETLAGLAPTEANYNLAIAVLKEKYGNHEKIIDHTMQYLLSTQPVSSKTDAFGLRRLYTSVLTSTRSLASLGVPSSHYFVMLKGVLLRCLPNDLRVDFHRFYDNLSKNLEAGNMENISDDKASISSASELSSAKSIGDKQAKALLKFLKREVEALKKSNEAKTSSSRSHHHQNTAPRNCQNCRRIVCSWK